MQVSLKGTNLKESLTSQLLSCARNLSNTKFPAFLLCFGTALICIAPGSGSKLPLPWFAGTGSSPIFGYATAVVAVSALLAPLLWKISNPATWTVALFWIAAAMVSGLDLAGSGAVTSAVALTEAIVLALAALALTGRIRTNILLYAVTGMLAVFGLVHVVHREAISMLIPDAFPYRAQWPLLTGAVMMAAAVAAPNQKLRTGALTVVALMVLAWLPTVHAPRLLADPSEGEVVFAATAAALLGAILLAMRTRGRRSNEAGLLPASM